MSEDAKALAGVNAVLDKLLGPEGCPWDKEQTLASLCEYAVEECYELVDAIRNGGPAEVREELGDLMFILLFMAKLGGKAADFTLASALDENAAKMARRHPHVFGDSVFENREGLLKAWEQIKKAEKAAKAEAKTGVFASLPGELPPLLKAYRIHSKSARAGFTWDSDDDAEQQVEAEWLEWMDAHERGDAAAMEHELGDLIFTLVELGRRHSIKASAALDKTNTRFLKRFAAMEARAAKKGQNFDALSQGEKDALWTEVKAEE